MNTNQPQRPFNDLLEVGARRSGRKALRLGIMHYHLKSSGVLSVMRDIMRSLVTCSSYESLEIDIFASVGDRVRAKQLFSFAGSHHDRTGLRIFDFPSLSYRSEPYPDRASFLHAAEALAEDILRQIDLRRSEPDCPYIMHAHNISLGKNPTVTMAFKRIAELAFQRSLPIWLINQVHDFAENNRLDQIKTFHNCTGRSDEKFARSFMYPSGPNILYLTINSPDIENLRTIGIPKDRIFLLPDPIDVTQFEQKPLWKMEEMELAQAGLPLADYKAILTEMLRAYATSAQQVFDAHLPFLLSPLKVMRRKNNVESLLLLALFERLGRRYQLLITLDANSPADIEYSRWLKLFASTRKIPVVIGFGKHVISVASRRTLEHGVVKQFAMCDLYALSVAILLNSIEEGFGLGYHEGWLSRKLVVGRKIPDVVREFESNGMNFDHMYEKFAVSVSDIPDLRERLFEAYKKKCRKWSTMLSGRGKASDATVWNIVKQKFFEINREACVDFADLAADMQFELLDRLVGNPKLANRLIDRNPAVTAMFNLLHDSDSDLIERNRSAVCSKYSLNAVTQRLENLFEIGDSLYKQQCSSVPLRRENHALLIEKYRAPKNLRLLL